MERRLVLRGFGAGAFAGLLAFVFARIFAEPAIQQAIDYESGRDAVVARLTRTPLDDTELFSRSVQRNVGLGVGVIVFGAAIGALFAVAYTITARYTPSLRPRARALIVAALSFVALYLVPFLKYPANPPAIGHPDTIKSRTLLYLTMMVVGVAGLIIAAIVGHRLTARLGVWNATLVVALGYLVVVGIAVAVLPDLGHLGANGQYGHLATETPQPLLDGKGALAYPGFPADTLFRFRLASLGTQVVLWAGIGLAFGPLADGVHGGARDGVPASSRTPEPVAAL